MLGLCMEGIRADMNRLLGLLFHQGVLDEQFLQLQHLQDHASPNFVSEVVNIYFNESDKLLHNLSQHLHHLVGGAVENDHDESVLEYNKIGMLINQFMGSSSSIGAKRVTNVCLAFRAASQQANRHGCLRALEMVEHEYTYLKNNLHQYFHLEQQRALAAIIRYPIQN